MVDYKNTKDIEVNTVQGLSAAGNIYDDILEKTKYINEYSGSNNGNAFREVALKIARDIALNNGTPIHNGKKVSEIADLLREVAEPERGVEPALLAYIRDPKGQQSRTRPSETPVRELQRDEHHDEVVKKILEKIGTQFSIQTNIGVARKDINQGDREVGTPARQADLNSSVQKTSDKNDRVDDGSRNKYAKAENESRSNWLVSAYRNTVAAVQGWASRVEKSEISGQTALTDKGTPSNPNPFYKTPEVRSISDAPRAQSTVTDIFLTTLKARDSALSLAPGSPFNTETKVFSSDDFDGQALDREIAKAVERGIDPQADLARTTALYNQGVSDIERDFPSANLNANASDRSDDSSIVSDITNSTFGEDDTISRTDQSQASEYSFDPKGSYHDGEPAFKNIEASGAFLGAESAQTGIEPKGQLASSATDEQSATPVQRGLEPTGELLPTNQPRTPDYAAEHGQLTDTIDELLAAYSKARTNLETQIAESRSVPILTYGDDASIIANDNRTEGAVSYATTIQNRPSATASATDYNQNASQLDDVVNTRLPSNADYSSDLLVEPSQANFKLDDRFRQNERLEI